MKRTRLLAAGLGLALLSLAPLANAQPASKKTNITFSQPVRVPGVTLTPGSYVFKLADSQSNRHIVQILNPREDKVYATVLTIPDYRVRPASKTIITFSESAPGRPTPIKAWFYPGDNTGNRFVYSKQEAAELAQAYKQPVPAVPPEVVSNAAKVEPIKRTPSKDPAVVAMAEAPVKAVTETGSETSYQPTDINDAKDESGFDATAAPPAQKLPQTASTMPLLALVGLTLLAASVLVRFAWKSLP
jgi:LPXTG-motif cell wall-anchored protein